MYAYLLLLQNKSKITFPVCPLFFFSFPGGLIICLFIVFNGKLIPVWPDTTRTALCIMVALEYDIDRYRYLIYWLLSYPGLWRFWKSSSVFSLMQFSNFANTTLHFPQPLNIMTTLGVTFWIENICNNEMLAIDSHLDSFSLLFLNVKISLSLRWRGGFKIPIC